MPRTTDSIETPTLNETVLKGVREISISGTTGARMAPVARTKKRQTDTGVIITITTRNKNSHPDSGTGTHKTATDGLDVKNY